MLSQTQQQFIDFLIKHKALRFGDFTLKSGRKSPYFFNCGVFHDGDSLAQLGQFYAHALAKLPLPDCVFGPAYKGIPLATATVIAFKQLYHQALPVTFNRKEVKDHGEGGSLMGAPIEGKVLLVDDVITAGTTIDETISQLAGTPAELTMALIAFDRQERLPSGQTMVEAIQARTGIVIESLINREQLVEALSLSTAEHRVWAEQLANI